MHLERFKNKKFSYPGEGDTPSPGPHPPALRKIGVFSLEVALLTWLIKHLCKMDITSYFADFQDGKIMNIARKKGIKMLL